MLRVTRRAASAENFFLIDQRKILQLKELRNPNLRRSSQNLQNKDFIRKIFKNKELRSTASASFFRTRSRKILIAGKLCHAARNGASQNLVKEGLTRKIFQNKDLASPELRVPSVVASHQKHCRPLAIRKILRCNAHVAIVRFRGL